MAKNNRQPYAVSPLAGMQHSAESWGTGRAVSRIPRVSGGGTHRAGQGAFGNMCRKGRMYNPTKIYRRWHRKVNIKQKRYSVCAALAATALPALVMARGHRINGVPEIPLVLSDSAFEGVVKAKEARKLLSTFKIDEDVDHCKARRRHRAGKGKARNRRHISKKGPLVIFSGDGSNVVRGFRNMPGVEIVSVQSLNVLTLAPGGHLGRFVVWTEKAFKSLQSVYGSFGKVSKVKGGFKLPSPVIRTPDINRIVNAPEVKALLRPKRNPPKQLPRKKNPLKNFIVRARINPYARTLKREAILRKRSGVEKPKLTKEQLEKRKVSRKQQRVKSKKIRRGTAAYRQILLTPAVAPAKSADETGPSY